MHLHAVLGQALFELLQQIGQPGQAVLADRLADAAQLLEGRRVAEMRGARLVCRKSIALRKLRRK